MCVVFPSETDAIMFLDLMHLVSAVRFSAIFKLKVISSFLGNPDFSGI